ncbi:hypothetical protein RHSIM_Rhsim04G0027000 [Rhododendron simsii]|uniref:Pentatricopeptide repeat-containing protein n=1 Tax=Rhododendron simsii TaxID=118357 RepID=A0A834H3I6_RHOSS|nr:hypothetical protein RHSIM_Rhsim04G0027000 [Rhododendron simsii]
MAKPPKSISPFRLASLLRLQKDPNLALHLFLNPNPNANKPFRYSLLSYDLIITKLGRAKMLDEMDQILQQLKTETRFNPGEIIFCNIITFYGRARLPDRALHIFNQIPSFRCQRTIKSFNTLLNALLSCREFGKMREVFVGLNRFVAPDACSYNVLIRAGCLMNDLGSAREVFDEMQKRGVRPDAVTFGTLISGLCAGGKLDEAFKLKEDMERGFRVRLDGFVYASLIKGLCKVNELSLAFKLKDEMLERRVELDSAVFSTLISALFKAGRKGDVVGVLKEMKENKCKLDAITYNAMIYGYCQEKDFDAAFGVLSEMEKRRCKPDVVCYNVIIGGFCREGKFREATELFEDMPRRKCAPDVVTYRTLFSGLCDGKQFQEAALILDEMVFKDYSPSAASIVKFVDELCQAGNLKLLWTILNSLAKGNLIDSVTWGRVIPMVCENNKLLNASALIETLLILSRGLDLITNCSPSSENKRQCVDEKRPSSASSSWTESDFTPFDMKLLRGYGGFWTAAYTGWLRTAEARVLLSKEKEVPSMEDNLILSALPKGTTPRSSPSYKGHAMAINERLYVLPIPHADRVLQAVPSPGVGH